MNKIEKRDMKIKEAMKNGSLLEAFNKVANNMNLERTDYFNDALLNISTDELTDFKPDYDEINPIHDTKSNITNTTKFKRRFISHSNISKFYNKSEDKSRVHRLETKVV